MLAKEALLQDLLLCRDSLEARKDGLSIVCHPTGLLGKFIQFLWARVSNFPTDTHLQDLEMRNWNSWEFLKSYYSVFFITFCIF